LKVPIEIKMDACVNFRIIFNIH